MQSIGRDDAVAALASESSLSAPQLESLRVSEVVAGPESIPLYVFRLSNGRTLRVTEHHGMVLSDGRVVRASEVQPDASFLSGDGSLVTLRAIERENASEPVVNFRIDTEEVQEHVVVAEGILVGDLFLQNELGREQASIQLRK